MSTGYKKCLYSDLRTQCMDKFVRKITFISIIILFLKHLYLSSRILNSFITWSHIQYGEINLHPLTGFNLQRT